MALPQGLDFRLSAAFVTDPTNCIYEIDGSSSPYVSYPRITPQGNTVGWETNAFNWLSDRNRNASLDARLAGFKNVNMLVVQPVYRVDLPAAGSYNIGLAAGDSSYGQSSYIELFDTSTSLGVLVNGTTTGANRWFDATGTQLTNVTWPTSNTKVAKTFATTILRLKLGNGSTVGAYLAHLWVESAGGASTVVVSEAASAADAQASSFSTLAANVEAASSAAVQAANFATAAALNEAASASDSQTATSGAGARAIVEAAAATDSCAATVSRTAAIAEAAASSDVTASSRQVTAASTAAAAAGDAVNWLAGTSVTLTESAVAADSIAAQIQHTAAMAEAANASDEFAYPSEGPAPVSYPGFSASYATGNRRAAYGAEPRAVKFQRIKRSVRIQDA